MFLDNLLLKLTWAVAFAVCTASEVGGEEEDDSHLSHLNSCYEDLDGPMDHLVYDEGTRGAGGCLCLDRNRDIGPVLGSLGAASRFQDSVESGCIAKEVR